ncbi:hypothetical protein FACS189490_04660 [Clostridia bacterium]|nr:hypothetical protein FACS189490_04660 [Clostridia bacterium]
MKPDADLLMGFNYAADGLTVFVGVKSDAIISGIYKINEKLSQTLDYLSVRQDYYEVLNLLIRSAEENGFSGDILKRHIASLFVKDVNLFSLARERGENLAGKTINELAYEDVSRYMSLLSYDFSELSREAGESENVTDYSPVLRRKNAVADALSSASSVNEAFSRLSDSYEKYGAGELGNCAMFSFENGVLLPIENPDNVTFDDILFCETEHKTLRENAEAFLSGYPAGNTLLIGARGTGKSSSVKALVNEYFAEGLRLVELSSASLSEIPALMKILAKRGKRFIVFLDDLSFSETETGYKYLKSALEGGAGKLPENVLFFATSNRRHIVSESFADRAGQGDELHANDTVNEKLSLADRFAVTITFQNFSPDKYAQVALALSRNIGVNLSDDEILKMAKAAGLSFSGLSGRAARNFSESLAFKYGKKVYNQ